MKNKKDISVNRMTIREANMTDLSRVYKLLKDDGFNVSINGHYLVFYRGERIEDENIL
jgi:MoaA/NifB/PqqE/SkfB family radical SAM enzyme